MSVKSFKFVSPGVFINEIDNSFRPRATEDIGPVVVGRATRGLALQPIRVESYSEFVEVFGDTVPGGAGGDVYRRGNFQSPMYGTFAAKAFLNANVAPLTYIRLLGAQHPQATTAGKAGWNTTNTPFVGPHDGTLYYQRAGGAEALGRENVGNNGGAYGLFLFPSTTRGTGNNAGTGPGTGHLAAIIYADSGSAVFLSGTLWGATAGTSAGGGAVPVRPSNDQGIGKLIVSAGDRNTHTLVISSSVNKAAGVPGTETKFSVNFDDNSDRYIRGVLNTNPQLASAAGTFFATDAHERYWLAETYDNTIRSASLSNAATIGVLYPLALSGAAGGSATVGPFDKRVASQEARAGWFIGQNLGAVAAYQPQKAQKLFRLIGRGHGEWLNKNAKVSIEKIRQSTTKTSDYGTFSVVIRLLQDTDNAPIILERFDNLTLDPASPNFIAKQIGDQFNEWDTTSRRLKTYGDYPNRSKYIYVDMESAVEEGATDPRLLPFGYYGPPKYRDASIEGVYHAAATGSRFTSNSMIRWDSKYPGAGLYAAQAFSGSGTTDMTATGLAKPSSLISSSMTLKFPEIRLRQNATDGGVSDPRNAYFGIQTTRNATSTRHDDSVQDAHCMLDARLLQSVDTSNYSAITGVNGYCYIFSLDDVKKTGSDVYQWQSGSCRAGISVTSGSYEELLNQGYNRFTAPFFGGYDGFDIKVPDPLYNAGMAGASETTSAAYYTIKRAIDTIADPESVDMNLLTMPGLTNDSLTQHMINVCEDRGDAMSLIDLANVYTPSHEAYNSDKKNRLGPGPEQVSNQLKDRRIDSSYGATFYPWVQIRDEASGQLLWAPPSVAMLGVLASSQARSHLWFAPAGFNRGGLSEGAAGIPVVSVSERLTSKERDTLYEANINPIASFPSSGLVVFGQKTLQERQSALDRINVRRLVIFLKKQISILSTQVLFEQNVPTTWNRFKSLVEPFLANVKVQFGVTDYKLILDETTTTPDLVDQNILYAKIMVKPARAIEYIAIDFVIASTGASFDD